MGLKIQDKIIELLKQNPESKFTAKEIAEWVFREYPEECLRKKERSKATRNPLDTDERMIAQLTAEVGATRPSIQKKVPNIKTTEEKPKKYYYTPLSDEEEVNQAENPKETPPSNHSNEVAEVSFRERDLYPLLSRYLRSELNVYGKRIDEGRSSNKHGSGGNRWLHPDLVGMEILGAEWCSSVKDCVKIRSDKRSKLWSFEVKMIVNRSNVREVFFQTVSNSSWANFGYLVASEISGSDTLKELRILANLHGIGFILLDKENPSESQIIIPAKERDSVNWDTINRLASENPDFDKYITAVLQFYQTGSTHEELWDKVNFDDDDD